MFEGLRTPTQLVVIVITLLAFGCPVQAIVRAYGLDERTVALARSCGEAVSTSASGHCRTGQLDLIHVQKSRRDPGESAQYGGVDGIGDML